MALLYASQVMETKSDITENETVWQAAKTFVKAMDAMHQRRRAYAWEKLSVFLIINTFWSTFPTTCQRTTSSPPCRGS